MARADIKEIREYSLRRRKPMDTSLLPKARSVRGKNRGYIHPLAIVDAEARLADGVRVGPWSMIGADVEIGENTLIGAHVVIQGPARIGRENRIYPLISIGSDPQDKKYAGESTRVEIGDRNVMREFCTVHRGTKAGGGVTQVGDDNWFMAYVHVAHDCRVGNDTVLANGTTLAGCVTVEDYAYLGLYTLVHPFCLIGAHSCSAMGSTILKDVPPYLTVSGNSARPRVLNTRGLKRNGFRRETIRVLGRAFKILYRQGLTVAQAAAQLKALEAECPEVTPLVDFLKRSTRGIVR